jgi:uncharacterized protein YabN with tetrapyrrole methylase and pyrophosphatase domain
MVILEAAMDRHEAATPALRRALRLQEQAAEVGLDWPEADSVWSRINDELAQAKAASENASMLGSRLAAKAFREAGSAEPERGRRGTDPDRSLLTDELGDLLFAVVDVCRMLEVDPHEALQRSNDQFQACFNQVQRTLCEEGRLIGLESPERLKSLWIRARRAAGKTAPVPFWLAEEEEADVRGNLA